MGSAGMLRLVPPVVAALSLLVSACQSQPPASAPSGSAAPTAAAAPAAQPTVAAAAPAKLAQGGTVTVGLDQEPPTLDPEATGRVERDHDRAPASSSFRERGKTSFR